MGIFSDTKWHFLQLLLAIIETENVGFGTNANEDIFSRIFKLCPILFLLNTMVSGLEKECEPETKYEDNNFTFLSLFSFTTFVVVTCFRYFDGSPLSSAWHVTSTTSPVLLEYAVTLDLVEFSDSGLYECRPDKLDPVSVNLHVVKGKRKQSQCMKKYQKITNRVTSMWIFFIAKLRFLKEHW